jgi:hypothetical protein
MADDKEGDAKRLLNKLPRPPDIGARDASALASGQNSQVILDRIKAQSKGKRRRIAAGARN